MKTSHKAAYADKTTPKTFLQDVLPWLGLSYLPKESHKEMWMGNEDRKPFGESVIRKL